MITVEKVEEIYTTHKQVSNHKSAPSYKKKSTKAPLSYVHVKIDIAVTIISLRMSNN